MPERKKEAMRTKVVLAVAACLVAVAVLWLGSPAEAAETGRLSIKNNTTGPINVYWKTEDGEELLCRGTITFGGSCGYAPFDFPADEPQTLVAKKDDGTEIITCSVTLSADQRKTWYVRSDQCDIS